MALRAVINEIKASADGQNLNVQVQLLDENDTEVKAFVFTQGPDNVSESAILRAIVSNTRAHLDEVKRIDDIAAVVTGVEVERKSLEGKAFDLTGIMDVVLKETEHIEDKFDPKPIEK